MLSDYVDKDELRKTASLAAVAQALGVRVNDQGYAPCPFHDDHRPSFNIYETEDGQQRCGCFPCGFNGDVFDLVQRVRERGFGDAVRFVANVMGESPSATIVARQRRLLDEGALRTYVANAMSLGATSASEGYLCVAAGLSTTRDQTYDGILRWLGWGCDTSACVVIPHWDRASKLTGAKVRAPDGRKWSFPGSSFTDLYGSWLPRKHDALLLCEGETDFAHSMAQVVPADSLSLPTGAGKGVVPESWIEHACRWNTVYFAFDGDQAGDDSTARWIEQLRARAFHPVLRRLPVPSGTDLRDCGEEVATLMRNAVAV